MAYSYSRKTAQERWFNRVNQFLTVPTNLNSVFLELRNYLMNFQRDFNEIIDFTSKLEDKQEEINIKLNLLTDFLNNKIKKLDYSIKKQNNFSDYSTLSQKNSIKLRSELIYEIIKKINVDCNSENNNELSNCIRKSMNNILYNLHLKQIEERKAEINDQKISQQASKIRNYINKILSVYHSDLYKERFDLNKEINNLSEVIEFFSNFMDLLEGDESEQSEAHKLYKILKILTNAIFPLGKDFEETFSLFLEQSEYFPLQIEMISGSNLKESASKKSEYNLLTHNLIEFIEMITNTLNTNPVYQEIDDTENMKKELYPGIIIDKTHEIFIGNIASGIKEKSSFIMKEIGFINIDLDTNSNNENEEENGNENENDLESSDDKKEINSKLFFMGPTLINLLKKHDLIQTVQIDDKTIKHIPTFDTETIYQLLLSKISLNRKTQISSKLTDKIAGFFSLLIYKIIIFNVIRKTNNYYQNETLGEFESLLDHNLLFKFINSLQLKIELISRLKWILAFPKFLNLNAHKIASTKVRGRTIFDDIGRETEQINQLIFRLSKDIDL